MSSEEQPNAARAVAPEPIPEPVLIPVPIPVPIPPLAPPSAPAAPWMRPEVWMLGVFSAVGLIGFILTFVMIVLRSPNAPVPRPLTAADMQGFVGPKGNPGPAGPVGARGPVGDTGIRVLRNECVAANCTAECADDEVLLTAYCGPNRTAAAFPSEHSALCRVQPGRGKIEVVAACAKSARR